MLGYTILSRRQRQGLLAPVRTGCVVFMVVRIIQSCKFSHFSPFMRPETLSRLRPNDFLEKVTAPSSNIRPMEEDG